MVNHNEKCFLIVNFKKSLEANIGADSLAESMTGLKVDSEEIFDKEAEEVVKKMEKSYTESFYQVTEKTGH